MAESISTAVFSLMSIMLIGRAIGADVLGAGTIALSAFLLIDTICAAIFTDALVQHRQPTPLHYGSATTVHILAGAGGALLLVGLAPVVAGASGTAEVGALMIALSPLLPISAWSGAAASQLMRDQRFALLALRALIGQPLALLVALELARLGAGAWAMAASQAALTLITAALLLLRSSSFPRFALDRDALSDLWRVAGPQIAFIAVLVGRYRVFMLVLGMVSAPAVVALSHIAFRLIDGALVIVYQSSPRIGLPQLAPAYAAGDRERLAEAFGSLAQLQALMALPISVGIALVAPDMVAVMLGPGWEETALATQIVALSVVPGFLLGDPITLFTALGRTRVNLTTALVGLVLPVSLVLIAAPTSATGVALCAVSTCFALPVPLAVLSLRAVGRRAPWILRKTLPALLAGAVMAGAVLLLRTMVPMSPLAGLLASAGVGAAVYLGVAAALLGFRLPSALLRQPATP